jgi:hypothetical protein
MDSLQRPNPKQAGYIVGRTIELSGFARLADASNDETLATAAISRHRLSEEFLLLASAAALHAIESLGFAPELETAIAQGLYDWFREQPASTYRCLADNVDTVTDRFAQAAADEAANPKPLGEFTELELEFIDGLIALGEPTEGRIRACVELGAVSPAHLWAVSCESTRRVLREAGLLGRDRAAADPQNGR